MSPNYDRVAAIFSRGDIPEKHCKGCGWVGTEDEYYRNLPIGPVPDSVPCPQCQSTNVWDYESTLYKAGYR